IRECPDSANHLVEEHTWIKTHSKVLITRLYQTMAAAKPTIQVAAGQWMPFGASRLQANGTYMIEGPMRYLLEVLSHHMNFE
ncbi:hypothetical protein Hamer_G006130, partial [Homarus americanus]